MLEYRASALNSPVIRAKSPETDLDNVIKPPDIYVRNYETAKERGERIEKKCKNDFLERI
jgi:hypothetical protein